MNNEIPQGWQLREATDFSEVISGSTPDTSNPRYWNGDIIWITPEDLSKNSKVHMNNSNKKISNLGLKNSSAKTIPGNSIVMSSRAPIGYLAVVTSEYTTNQGCKSLHMLDSTVPEFIYYSLLLNMNEIKQRGEGTTFSEISKKDFEKISFLMPRLPSEQKKIASILQNVDNAIDKTKIVIEKHKMMRLGLMQDLLNQDLDTWSTAKLSIVSSFISRGKSPEYAENGENFVINQACIHWDDFKFDNLKRIKNSYFSNLPSNYVIKKDDIFINSTGTGTIGRVQHLMKEEAFTWDSHVTVIRTNGKVFPRFLYYSLQTYNIQNQIEIFCITGSTNQVELSTAKLKEIEIKFPTKIAEQERIAFVLNSIDANIHSEKAYLDKLNRIKIGLMQDLLTGKVRVAA